MAKRSLASLSAVDLRGKRVLVRVDFNVPLDDAGAITDDTRIRAALPTIGYLRDNGARVLLAAHFGRPKGQVNEGMRLTAVAARLSDLLGVPVAKTDSCIGADAEAKVAALGDGGVVLLEGLRTRLGSIRTGAEVNLAFVSVIKPSTGSVGLGQFR